MSVIGERVGGRVGKRLADAVEVGAVVAEDAGGEATFFAQQSEQQVFDADARVSQPLGLFRAVGQRALALAGKRQIVAG